MCYPKPGPRCSRHVKNDIKKHHKSAQKAGDKASLMREHMATSDNPYGKYSYDDVIAKENEREGHLKAYREALSAYKQTPAGLKVLRKSAIEAGMTPEQMDQIDKEIKEDDSYELIDQLKAPYSNTPNAVHEYIHNKGARQLQLNNYNNGTNFRNISISYPPQSNSALPSTTDHEMGRVQREHQRAQKNKMDNRFPETGSTGDATNSPYTQTPTSTPSQGSHLSENYDKTNPYEGAEVLIEKDKTTIIPPKPKEKPVFPTSRPKN